MGVTCWGIGFESEVDLPGAHPADRAAEADVTVRFGAVPESIDGVRAAGVAYEAAPGVFLMRVPGVAAYLVEGGGAVTVDPAPGSSPDAVRLLLTGTPIAALLHQRGRVPLHASAVEVDGKAVLFAGASAAGKSAVAAAWHDAGHRVVADETCALHVGPDGAVMVEPGPAQLLVWRHTLKLLGHEPDGLERARPELAKFRLPVDAVGEPLEVSHVVVLDRELGTHAAGARTVTDAHERIATLLAATRCGAFLDALGAGAAHFRLTAAMTRRVVTEEIRRPDGRAGLDAVREHVEVLLGRSGEGPA